MQTAITFRNLDATEAIKAYARAKVERAEKYIDIDTKSEAHVVLALEKHLHLAEITLHTGTFFLHGRERSEDMYASIDLAMDKIERQLKRFKEKLKSRRHQSHHGSGFRVRHDVLAPLIEELTDSPPRIIRTDEFHAKPMTVEEAVLQMDLVENDFFVFQNASSREVNVVFRRKDGNYGLIEAHTR
jgi:putative sigma-54 modulation protein